MAHIKNILTFCFSTWFWQNLIYGPVLGLNKISRPVSPPLFIIDLHILITIKLSVYKPLVTCN